MDNHEIAIALVGDTGFVDVNMGPCGRRCREAQQLDCKGDEAFGVRAKGYFARSGIADLHEAARNAISNGGPIKCFKISEDGIELLL